MAAAEIAVVSMSDTPPFPVEDRVEVDEALRLRYRYLDLRRPEMTGVLRTRHRRSLRSASTSTRGVRRRGDPDAHEEHARGRARLPGPSRLQRGKVYALPQSPQQFKQLLMVAGIDRYYQIVRCFRDEDLRADRHWEFTQLDAELSFATEEDVFEMFEGMFASSGATSSTSRSIRPFPGCATTSRWTATARTSPIRGTAWSSATSPRRSAAVGSRRSPASWRAGEWSRDSPRPAPRGWSRKELDGLIQEAKSRGAAGLVWLAVQATSVSRRWQVSSSPEELAAIAATTGAGEGDLALLVADAASDERGLDGLRRLMAERLDLVPPGRWNFLWVTEFPVFEWDEEEAKWDAQHHPFTAPVTDELDPATASARAYDIVLNGIELGSGSVRIHDPRSSGRSSIASASAARRRGRNSATCWTRFGTGSRPTAGSRSDWTVW